MAKLGSRLTFEGPDENLGSAVLFLNDSLHGLTVYRIDGEPICSLFTPACGALMFGRRLWPWVFHQRSSVCVHNVGSVQSFDFSFVGIWPTNILNDLRRSRQ